MITYHPKYLKKTKVHNLKGVVISQLYPLSQGVLQTKDGHLDFLPESQDGGLNLWKSPGVRSLVYFFLGIGEGRPRFRAFSGSVTLVVLAGP